MIIGDNEYKWIVKGTHNSVASSNVTTYHNDKLGLTLSADDATQYDNIGDAMRKAIYRNSRDKNGFVYRIERIEIV